MKIRNYLLGTLLFMIAFWVSAFAFEPNQQQQEELASFKGQIAPLVEKDNYALWNFYEQARDLHLYFKEEKTAYYLEHLRDFFLTKFLTRKDLAKSESSSLKSDFLSQIGSFRSFESKLYWMVSNLGQFEFCLWFSNSINNCCSI